MPIYVVEGTDHRQITTDDLAKMMKIDKKILDKLKKNPVFEINPKLTKPDKLNGGVIAPAGKMSKPKIYLMVDKFKTHEFPNGVITESTSGIRIELRYAVSIVPDRTNERLSTYEPKRLVFYDRMDVVPNIEEALFKYILPSCKDSPVADKRNWYYSFQNKEAAATVINEKGAQLVKALAYISNTTDQGGLTEQQLILVAKGIYAQNRNPALIPNPSAINKTFVEIKADLVTFAIRDPEVFLNCCDDDVNEFYGMLLDSVDRNIFGVRKGGGSVRGWYWEKGPQVGTHIVDIGPGVNDFDALKGAVEANPNAYYASITKAVTEAVGKQNISDFIKTQKSSADIKQDQDAGSVGLGGGEFSLPTNYEDSVQMAILFNDGKRPGPKILGHFWTAIKDGKVTAENAKSVLAKITEEVV